MKGRTTLLLAGVAAGAVAFVVWRRRSAPSRQDAFQLGLAGSTVLTLDQADPATSELEALAAGVRDSFPGGA